MVPAASPNHRDYGNGSEVLSVLNSDLPLLASRAAAELDNVLIGRSLAVDNVRLLAERLNKSMGPAAEAVEEYGGDPATLNVIAHALDASHSRIKTMHDAVQEALKVAQELHSAIKSPEQSLREDSEKLLAKLRTFCIDLARSAAIYRNMIDEGQPGQSHWS